MLHVVDYELAAGEFQHLADAGSEKLEHHRARQRLAAHGSLAQRPTSHFDPPSIDRPINRAQLSCCRPALRDQCAPKNARPCGAASPTSLNRTPTPPNPPPTPR